MVNYSHSASDYVNLGEILHALQNPQVSSPSLYVSEVGKFFTLLERIGLESTRRMATSLEGLSIPGDHLGRISHVASLQLSSKVHPISTRLYEETIQQSLILCDGQINPKLVSLLMELGRELQPHQEVLRQDLEMCLRARLYRPAIVAAWNLGYDLIRWWIFEDSHRLADFNNLLSQRTANHRKGSRTIGRYDDFFFESEAFVLENCRDASGSLSDFSDKTYRQLQRLLDDRNAFAHANYDEATEAEAKSYVDRIIRILTNTPFR
jgi:hypothetical protein